MAQMVQEAQQLKIEINSSLDSLSLDSLQMLSKFVTFLRTDDIQQKMVKVNEQIEVNIPSRSLRISNPRLVHRHQMADFKKEIVV